MAGTTRSKVTSMDQTPKTDRPNGSMTSVEARAYEIWVAEGRPEGKALEHWLQAEGEFSTKHATTTRPSRGKSKDGDSHAH